MYPFARAAATLALGLAPALAPGLAQAQDVLLTVTAGDEITEYDRAALEALGETAFTTSTIWTEGPQTFTGVPLGAVIEDAGMDTGTLTALAINDYAVEIPVEEALEEGPIIAYLRNGEEMPVRDKGPLWLVYPYDSDIAFQTEVVYARSIWQLDRLVLSE